MQVANLNKNTNLESSTILDKAKSRRDSIVGVITANNKFSFGMGVVLLFALIAIFAPLLTHYNPEATLVVGAHPPSAAHILGTTAQGQDVLAQLMYGARITLLVSFSAATGSTLLQILFGLSSAYFGGVVDDVLSMIINIFLVLPGLPLTIVLASLASASGVSNNEVIITLVLLFTSWPYGARVLRSQTLSLKEREFVSAARASGETSLRIVFAEILPNELALVASAFVTTFVYAIGTEVALEFLGLGDVTKSSWGVMLYWAQNGSALLTGKWWLFLPPGLCIAILCAALTFVNFGIDELANPRLRRDLKLKPNKKQKAVA
ncbi:MAG: ABC transporter permease [Ktedonobacteraceae bacterium]|nr:ABC transporter permease [Ktedonobacteraceae bacterium]